MVYTIIILVIIVIMMIIIGMMIVLYDVEYVTFNNMFGCNRYQN